MMKRSYVSPELLKNAFHCPHCSAYATHTWGRVDAKVESHYIRLPDFRISRCSHCLNFAIWAEDVPIYPNVSQAPPPSSDLPFDIALEFEEARDILKRSARCAAALFRLSFQKLCCMLGGTGENLEKDVDYLIQRGLIPKIKKNLESVRVIGPDAVQTGMIDPADDIGTAIQISQLINIIVNTFITQPKLLDDLNEKVDAVKEEETVRRTVVSRNVRHLDSKTAADRKESSRKQGG